MRKQTTEGRDHQELEKVGTMTVQLPLPLLSTLAEVEDGLFGLFVETGRQVLGVMMEQDRTALCGPKWVPNRERETGRAGSTASEVTLGGRRITIRRPRARSVEGEEMQLPSFVFAADRDPLDRRTMEAVAIGVSDRNYRRSLESLPPWETDRSTSRSAVSRRFVQLSKKMLGEWMSRPLADLDVQVVMIDGLWIKDHCLLIALGIAADGSKQVLGVREGSTEHSAVVQGLLNDLRERGLRSERALVFVIDGSKALHKAITGTFGPLAQIQRCQEHKRRNVLGHLPENMWPSVERAMREAYDTSNPKIARRKLEGLVRSLENDHPGAAASLREGLEETLTLQKLGVTGALYKTLRTTNPIENLNGSVTHFTRNVRRWRDGSMIVRWVTTALHYAEKKFRRVRGCDDMNQLVAALDKLTPKEELDNQKNVA